MNIHSDFELPTVQSLQTVLFFVCGSSARLKPFVFSFAGVPRGRNYLYSHLRKFREAETICILICGSSARLKPFVFSFAEVPRGRNHLYFRLREFRGAETICILVCGSSARLKLFVFLFAEVLQASILRNLSRGRAYPRNRGTLLRLHRPYRIPFRRPFLFRQSTHDVPRCNRV